MKKMKGTPGDLELIHAEIEYLNEDSKSLEIWNLYDRGSKDGFQRWKLSAQTDVVKKANYSLVLKDGSVHSKEDGWLLKDHRPGLYAKVSDAAAGKMMDCEKIRTDEVDDPFGDHAIARGGPTALLPIQQWNRQLLIMRSYELHWICRPDQDKIIGESEWRAALAAGAKREDLPKIVKADSWEHGVRVTWYGIFKGDLALAMRANTAGIQILAERYANQPSMKALGIVNKVKDEHRMAASKQMMFNLTSVMPTETLRDAIAFITRRGEGEIDFKSYSRAMKDFYGGRFRPTSYQTLAATLDAISGFTSPKTDDIAPVEPKAALAIEDLLA